jgi:hypothetical protein
LAGGTIKYLADQNKEEKGRKREKKKEGGK